MALRNSGNKPDTKGYLILGLRNIVKGKDGKEWATFKGSLSLPDGQSISVQLKGVIKGDMLTLMPKPGKKNDNPVVILEAAHWEKSYEDSSSKSFGSKWKNR